MKRIFLIIPTVLSGAGYQTPNGITIEPYGYVRMNPFFDSRQVFGQRDTDFLFFPQPFVPDCTGKDINDHGVFTMLPIETRIGYKLTGPDAFCAKVLGLIEAEFFGVRDDSINTLRMRHAFFELERDHWKVRFGQYWHPFFIDDCRARTISYNLGAPYGPYSRAPQVRFSYEFTKEAMLLLAALSELDFRTDGPVGQDTRYIRNAIVPELHAQVQLRPRSDIIFGGALDYKRIVPRLVNDLNCRVDESLNTVIAEVFLGYNGERLSCYFEALYTENARDLQMLGGYAVSSKSSQDCRTYTPFRVFSGWVDVETYGKCIRPGIFVGFEKNFGTTDPIFLTPEGTPIVFGLGTNINWSVRVSPRIWFIWEPVSFATELEISTAAFGTIDRSGIARNPVAVTNARFLLAGYYFF